MGTKENFDYSCQISSQLFVFSLLTSMNFFSQIYNPLKAIFQDKVFTDMYFHILKD